MGIDGRMKRERIESGCVSSLERILREIDRLPNFCYSPWMEWKSRISRECYYFERRRHRLENSSLFLSIRIHLVSILVLNTRYSRDKDEQRKERRKKVNERKNMREGREPSIRPMTGAFACDQVRSRGSLQVPPPPPLFRF